MFYDRKIKYLDYMEHGERLRNCGFVKLEARDKSCNIAIHISGLHNANINSCQSFLISGERREKLCEIQLQQGKGDKVLQLNCDNICAGISYHQIEALQIPITRTGELRCRIAERSVCAASADNIEVKHFEKIQCEEVGNEETCRGNAYPEEIHQKEVKPQKTKSETRTVPLLEDKWKQLSEIYPHINPFRDEREYLSIGPGDFVIMPRQYYKLINNSFLLHGFYNYRHLILACVEKRGETRYYVGVPGNFYDREKQVALMFGFESFECREEPAGVGDFGYYMMRVEI